ncbi:hypothetical protein DRQ50_03390 [bacterium]|nr:MAG: hypothetical protein DRQ50_03390 [bacterium]
MILTETAATAVAALPLTGCSVLVADDDPVCREVASAALAAAGAAVGSVDDGRKAVLQIAARVPDVLVTDVDMPELDGLATAGILRWDFGLVTLPIVALSAQPPPATELLACGINAYLTKPVTAEQLISAVSACLTGLNPSATGGSETSGRAPVFDVNQALTRMGGRWGLLERLVDVFLNDHRDSGHRLSAALIANDLPAARHLCHTLSGTGATVGADRLHLIARRLSHKLDRHIRPEPALLSELTAVLDSTLATMHSWRNNSR